MSFPAGCEHTRLTCAAALEQGDIAEFNQCLAALKQLYAEGVRHPSA